jgi:hypothetical protein
MIRETPSFNYNTPEGEKTGEILPPVKDLEKIWSDLWRESKDAKEAESFMQHVRLFKMGPGPEDQDYYLILTDVTPEGVETYASLFGAKKNPMDIEKFLLRANKYKATSRLPESFNSDTTRIFPIIT